MAYWLSVKLNTGMAGIAAHDKMANSSLCLPSKIPNEELLKDVVQYPDNYIYEGAQRFGRSKSDIEAALKRLGISKKDLRASKSLSSKEN